MKKYKLLSMICLIVLLTSCDKDGFFISKATFTKDYINSNDGKYTIEIPEVQELLHVIIAITDEGKKSGDFVDKSTDYYKKVIKRFDSFKDEQIVKVINEKLQGGRRMSSFGAYARYKMDACGFHFEKELIKKDLTYPQMNWDDKNYLDEHIDNLQNFAKKTNFQEFLLENKDFYNNQILEANKQLQIDKQWKWIEERFTSKYNNYRITFSPLVDGSHSTNRFEDNSFRQTVVFINGPFIINGLSKELTGAIYNRILFTEIDHNYVNPVSDKNKNAIEKIFKKKSKWANGGGASDYGSGYSIFNEYMTWAVFSLYAFDTMPKEIANQVVGRSANQMVNNRGFNRFAEFNQKLKDLYQKQAVKNIEALYPDIIEWAKKQ